MLNKKDLIGSELLREIIRIRLDALGKMLELHKVGRLPRVTDEGATGNYDNKGAIFIPGGLVFEDSDRQPIRKERYAQLSRTHFRKVVRSCMEQDNASLLFQDGYLPGVNLANGFFAEKSSQILAAKWAAGRRRRMLERRPPRRLRSDDICNSLCPEFMQPPYGSRNKLSSCIAVCMMELRLYYTLCANDYALRGVAARRAWERLRSAGQPVKDHKGEVLAPPYVVVCHQTRFREHILGGITRILGVGEFGEFATVTFEMAINELTEELKEKKVTWGEDEVFAVCDDKPVLGVVRHYPPTTPGARSRGSQIMLINHAKDLGYNAQHLVRTARREYRVDS